MNNVPKHRQDAWRQDEDTYLAETIINHIRSGSTQLKAFEEVGKQLCRTASACGFRWNAHVREQYEEAIIQAKKDKKQKAPFSEPALNEQLENTGIVKTEILSVDRIVSYLQTIHDNALKVNQLQEEIEELKNKVTDIEKQRNDALKEKEIIQEQLTQMETDYETLLAIMERARKMVLLHEEISK